MGEQTTQQHCREGGANSLLLLVVCQVSFLRIEWALLDVSPDSRELPDFVKERKTLLPRFPKNVILEVMKKQTVFSLVAVAMVFIACTKPNRNARFLISSPDDLLGKTFEQVIKQYRLERSGLSTIHEPPGVFRGISGDTKSGERIFLYVTRDKAFTNTSGAKLKVKVSDFNGKRIDGVALKRRGRWVAAGKGVLFYYHRNRPGGR